MKAKYIKPPLEVITIEVEQVISSSAKPNHKPGCNCAHCRPPIYNEPEFRTKFGNND